MVHGTAVHMGRLMTYHAFFRFYMMAAEQEVNTLWGWDQYFQELSTFISALGEERTFANERYMDYVLDRLTTCISTTARLVDHIESTMNATEWEEDEFDIVEYYQLQLSQLLECMREIFLKW